MFDALLLQYEAEMFALLCASGEAKEGVGAFLEKRVANFMTME